MVIPSAVEKQEKLKKYLKINIFNYLSCEETKFCIEPFYFKENQELIARL